MKSRKTFYQCGMKEVSALRYDEIVQIRNWKGARQAACSGWVLRGFCLSDRVAQAKDSQILWIISVQLTSLLDAAASVIDHGWIRSWGRRR